MSSEDFLKETALNLLDIKRGYSCIYLQNKKYYLKHFSILENILFENYHDEQFISAKNYGLKTNEELINFAIESNFWSKSKEEEIKASLWSIGQMNNFIKKMNDKGQILSTQKQIEIKKEIIEKINEEREKLVVYSAENYAKNKKIIKTISSCLFFDPELKEKVPIKECVDNIYEIYKKTNEFNSEKVLINVAYNSCFFDIFCIFQNQPEKIFDKNPFDLTSPQKNVLSYAHALLNKIKNVWMPEEIMKDPIKILNYSEKDKKDSSNKTTDGLDDLLMKSKQNGGVLKAEDFLS